MKCQILFRKKIQRNCSGDNSDISEFSDNFVICSYFSIKYICCGCSLEEPHQGASNEYSQHIFLLHRGASNEYLQ